MIEINLVPEDLRKPIREDITQKIPINLILLSANATLLVVFLVVTALNLYRTVNLGALKTRIGGLSAEQQKIVAINQKIKSLKEISAVFAPMLKQGLLWSEILNKLSDLTIPGIWLRVLSTEQKVVSAAKNMTATNSFSEYLVLEGSAVAPGKDEMAVIGEYIRNLKSDPNFIKYFRNMELESVLRRKISSIEVMDFTLLCHFKKKEL
ncbi:MAG: hypothetical protein KKB82_00385 [Candidatus Omnitrophica bacterium]|nr:hypothetical protein [Candidatus Omnitrophota bacterium]MBU1924359.1 hypothetical protein [Candidatus Omnitrophota bacterium]